MQVFTAGFDVLVWCSRFNGLWVHVAAAGSWIWGLVSSTAAAGWSALRRAVTTLYNGTVGVLSPIWRIISSVARNASTLVGNFCTWAWRALSNTVASVWNAAQPFWQLAWDLAARLGRAAWRPLKHAVRFVMAQFSKFTRYLR